MSIVGLGEILWDVYEDEKYIGGAPANFACDLVQLGRSAHLVSRVGKDRLGEELRIALKLRGVGVRYIQTDSIKATGSVLVKLNRGAIPSFNCVRDVAYDYLEITPGILSLAEKTDVVLFGSLAQRNKMSRSSIYQFLDISPAKLKLFDFNHRGRKLPEEEMVFESLRRAAVFKADKREWRIFKKLIGKSDVPNKKVFRYITDRFNLAHICVSLGRGGCVVSTGKEHHYSPGIKLVPVDTVGAGDAFLSGFVDASLDRKDLPEIASWANALGAMVASLPGASPKFKRQDIYEFLEQHTKRVSIEKYKNLEF